MAPSKHAARRFLFGIGALAAIAVVLLVAYTANQQRLPFVPSTKVRAEFANVGQLQIGSDVRQNGLPVGMVSAMQRTGDGHVLVTMELTRGVPMSRDGYAGIWDLTSLASKVVELRPGDSASGPLGDEVLPLERTESSHDLVQVLDVFDPPTRAALGNALRQLGGVAGYGAGLHDFFGRWPRLETDTRTIAATLVSERTDIPGLLHSFDRVESRFAGREYQLNEVVRQTDATLRALGTVDGAPMRAALSEMPTTLRAVRGALRDATPPLADLASASGNLRSGAHSLGEATPDVRAVFREGQAPLHEVPDFADDAKPAVSDLTHTVSDLRPLMPRVRDGLAAAATPLGVLKPYSLDIGTLAADLDSMDSEHAGWIHGFRALVAIPTLTSVNEVPIKDSSKMYSRPGEAKEARDLNGAFVPGDPGKTGK